MKSLWTTLFVTLVLLSACQPEIQDPSLALQQPEDPSPVPGGTLSHTPQSTIQIIKDVLYAESLHEGVEDQLLDIYAPRAGESQPVVVFLHGLGSSKLMHSSLSRQAAESGMVVFTVNWPSLMLRNSSEWSPRGLREIYEVLTCAVRFARENAADHGGDPTQIILIGFSAGANIAAWHALSGGGLEPDWVEYAASNNGDPAPQVACAANAQVPADVQAFIGIGGRYTRADFLQEIDTSLWEIVSPIQQMGRQPELRVRLMHGARDQDVPLEHSEYLLNMLLENGFDTDLIVFDGPHYVPIEKTIEVISKLTEPN